MSTGFLYLYSRIGANDTSYFIYIIHQLARFITIKTFQNKYNTFTIRR